MRMPPPADEQFLDPALMRHALLDDTFRQIGATLDLDQMARGLINIVVPHFCNSAGLLMLESLVGADEAPAYQVDGSHLLRRLAVASDDGDPRLDAAFPTGEVLRYPPGTPYTEVMDTGKPVRMANVDRDDALHIAEAWRRRPVARLLAGTSMLLLPLDARRHAARLHRVHPPGGLPSLRRLRHRDRHGVRLPGGDLPRQRAPVQPGARHRPHPPAQPAADRPVRALLGGGRAPLPARQPADRGRRRLVRVHHPAGARVALVVGDVAGHGVRAAVTMGRLRTAIQTLAMLELPPAESLQHLNELMRALGVREPHFATCAYAVYDAVHGTCEVASAGHLPPLLVRPDGNSEFLDVAPAPPLGVGEGIIDSRTFEIEDGSLLVLYTDGLVESRDSDIDDGLKRLREMFGPGSAGRPVEDLCKATLAGAYADQQRDDIAMLMARLSRIDGSQLATWVLPGELTSAGEARTLVSEPLEKWDLASMVPTTQLLVSELVTNAIRYTQGPVTLRLLLERTLTCEIADSSPALPRLRYAARDDESGRGLQIVSQLSQRWGARRTPVGKVVWCEQRFPRGYTPAIPSST